MKKAIKAALFSGLIFPGIGHFLLKRYLRGMLFFVPALLSLLMLIRNALDRAYTIANQIQQGDVPLDPDVISGLILAPPSAPVMLMLNIATWVIIACWTGSIIDSYLLGKKADQEEEK